MSEFGDGLVGDELTGDYSKIKIALDQMRNRKYVFGASLWTFNDYRSTHRSPTPSWETPLSENRAWGIYDAFGNKKVAYEQARKDYAPVKTMNVSSVGDSVKIQIEPRTKLDLPAYTLRNYNVKITDYDVSNNMLSSVEIKMPIIKPDDKTILSSLYLNIATNANRRIVSLKSPTNYDVLDTVIYLVKP